MTQDEENAALAKAALAVVWALMVLVAACTGVVMLFQGDLM